MAIDTAAKRASVLGFALSFSLLVVPDGSIDQGDRQTLLDCYNGIAAIEQQTWTDVADVNTIWSDQADVSSVWTDVPDQSTTWT